MIHESDRAKVDRAMHAYRVFNFTVNIVTAGLGVRPSQEDYKKIWQMVKDVASGDITLHATPAEIALANPGMTPAAHDAHIRSVHENSKKEREIASALLDAAEGFYIPPQKP